MGVKRRVCKVWEKMRVVETNKHGRIERIKRGAAMRGV